MKDWLAEPARLRDRVVTLNGDADDNWRLAQEAKREVERLTVEVDRLNAIIDRLLAVPKS